MDRETIIKTLLAEMFQNPVPGIDDWGMFLWKLTDDELSSLHLMCQKERTGVLVKEDLTPFIDIMRKYLPGNKGIILEHHVPEDDLSDDRTKWN